MCPLAGHPGETGSKRGRAEVSVCGVTEEAQSDQSLLQASGTYVGTFSSPLSLPLSSAPPAVLCPSPCPLPLPVVVHLLWCASHLSCTPILVTSYPCGLPGVKAKVYTGLGATQSRPGGEATAAAAAGGLHCPTPHPL